MQNGNQVMQDIQDTHLNYWHTITVPSKEVRGDVRIIRTSIQFGNIKLYLFSQREASKHFLNYEP